MRQWLSLYALEKHTANRQHVGREKAKKGKRDNDVEAEGRAKVDKAEHARSYGSEIDGVKRDILFMVHLKSMSA